MLSYGTQMVHKTKLVTKKCILHDSLLRYLIANDFFNDIKIDLP